jgi:hypothetical protein
MRTPPTQEVLMLRSIQLPLPPPSDLVLKKIDKQEKRKNSEWCLVQYYLAVRYLKAYGFQRRQRHLWLLLFLVVTFSATMFAESNEEWLEKDFNVERNEIVLAVWGLGVLLLAYQQWHENRYEISMDKYYERLDIANRTRREGGSTTFEMMRDSRPGSDEVNANKMEFLYTELDNLEYVAEKYYLGFMTPEQACRGLRTFQGRCLAEEFRNLARTRVEKGDYNGKTSEIVRRVVSVIEEENNQKPDNPALPSPTDLFLRRATLQKAAILLLFLSALLLMP